MRPPHPEREIPAGFEWLAIEEPVDKWRAVPPDEARPCRMRQDRPDGTRATCRAPSALALNRGRTVWKVMSNERSVAPAWWHYCAEHNYSRWVEDTSDGPRVFVWVIRELEP